MTFSENFFKQVNEKAPPKKEEKEIPGIKFNQHFANSSFKELALVGVELEIEGTNLHNEGALGKYWTVVQDGSLRNGKEYIFHQPLNISVASEAFDELKFYFEKNRTAIINSNRCSTHVHYNIRGRYFNEIVSLVVFWYLFEHAIVEWCGEERQNNHFCLTLKETSATIRYLSDIIRYGFGNVNRREGLKYSCLNILPMFDKGSIEVRCGPAFDDMNLAKDWTTFVHDFFEYAYSNYKNPFEIIMNVSERGALNIFKSFSLTTKTTVAKEILDKYKESEYTFNMNSMKAIREFQDILYENPWENWVAKNKEVYIPDPFEASSNLIFNSRNTNLRIPRTNLRNMWEPVQIQPQEIIREERENPAREFMDALERVVNRELNAFEELGIDAAEPMGAVPAAQR